MRRYLTTILLVSVVSLGVTVQGQRQLFPATGDLPFSAAAKGDGLIYVAGTIAAQGDIKAQAKAVLTSMGQTLTKAGSSLSMVASVNVYLKNAADAAAMTEVWRETFPKNPPARTTVVADFVVPGALVEMSAVAIPTGGERVAITPAGWSTANPYSYAIKSGDSLFLAGMVSRGVKDNQPIDGDMTAQMNTIMANAGELLKAAGFGFEHVVANRVYITDGTKFGEMNKAYVPHFPKDPPARATTIVGLPGPQYQVEVTMTANRRPKQAFATPNADGTPGRPSATLSSAVKVGNTLYLAGLLGNNATNKGDMEAQTKETLARVGRTLTAAGFGWNDLVDGTVWITDLAGFNAMNAGYRSVITKDFPARATVKSGLVGNDGMVEIMFIAAK